MFEPKPIVGNYLGEDSLVDVLLYQFIDGIKYVYTLSESEKDSVEKILRHLKLKYYFSYFADNKDVKLQELAKLIFFFQDKNFQEGIELIKYIAQHPLKDHYPNLTGTSTRWELKNGIALWVYRIVCQELGLSSELPESQKDSVEEIFKYLKERVLLSYNYSDREIKLQELAELIFFFQDKSFQDFQTRGELSKYITKHRLGMHYPNLTGTLTMRNGGDSWEFKNGIAPWAYRIVCEELDLINQKTRTVPEKFIPNKNLD